MLLDERTPITSLSPWTNLDGALERSHVVLTRMREEGFITDAQERAARAARIRIAPYPRRLIVTSPILNWPAAPASIEVIAVSSVWLPLRTPAHPLCDDRLELGRSLLPDAMAGLENIQSCMR